MLLWISVIYGSYTFFYVVLYRIFMCKNSRSVCYWTFILRRTVISCQAINRSLHMLQCKDMTSVSNLEFCVAPSSAYEYDTYTQDLKYGICFRCSCLPCRSSGGSTCQLLMQCECRALSFSSKKLYRQQPGDKLCYAKGELALVNIQVSQEECVKLREIVPCVKVYQYNPKHFYPKLNSYGDNGQRSLKLWQLLHTYWLPNTY